MKKILLGLGSIALALAIFAGGVYANEQGWLSFSGEDQIAESENHLNEIMEILRQVNNGKITAEEAELRLEGEVTQLTEDKDSLQDDIKYLEGLLEGLAGNTPGQKINKLKEANDNLRSQNAQLETEITGLQEDNEGLQGTIELRDYTIQGLENDVADLKEQLANAPEDQTDYVAHLEAELELANSLVETHHKATSDAVEEARGYGGDNSEQ